MGKRFRRPLVKSTLNPTMVRLLLDDIHGADEALQGFNPTMVRLLRRTG